MFKALKNRLFQLVAGLAFAAALMMSAGPAEAYTCACYCNPLYPNLCTTYTVDLLPSATWCGANPSPGANEILIYTNTNYYASYASGPSAPYCQRINVAGGGVSASNLATYDLNGPSFHIQSVWLGSNTTAAFYSGTGGSGSSHGLYGNGLYYENDMATHWGWFPASAIFNHL
jgi:hypothetical protein